jgi:hypothetical protein
MIMPLTTANPEVIDGIEYPYLGLSMAMMPDWRETSVGAMVAVELQLFRVTAAGKIERALDAEGLPVCRHMSFGDAFALPDPDLADAMTRVLSAVQDYITAKGI